MNNLNIKSPITNSDNVTVVQELNTNIIVRDYKNKYGVDVTRYFKDCSDKIHICKCEETGYRFYYPLTVAGDGKFYEDILEKNTYYPSWKKEYEIAANEIKTLGDDIDVLDVGCGNGTFLNGIKDLNIHLTGLEFNDAAIKSCKEKGIEVQKQSIENHAIANKGKYDVVTTFQVLEHVPEVQPFLEACIECLKPGGKLIISVPNNDPYYGGFSLYATANVPPHHMGLWNINTFKKLEEIFPIKLLSHDFDLEVSFPRALYYKGQYYQNNLFPKMTNNILGKICTALFSGFFLPIELIKKVGGKKNHRGRVITLFQKN